MQAQYGPTVMAGDGINDCPLARADIGLATGADGTDTAADIVVMKDDLHRISEVIQLSKRTRNILLQNIVQALGIKAVFLVLAVFGNAPISLALLPGCQHPSPAQRLRFGRP